MSSSSPPEGNGASHDRFASVVAICTVLTTLCAAAVGYVDARTARATEGSKVGALELSLDSLASQVEAWRATELQYDRFVQAQRARREAVNLRQQRLVTANNDPALRLEERRWEWLARRFERTSTRIAREQGTTPLTPAGRDGPETDPNFPAQYYARYTTLGGELLLAQRDAANEQETARAGQRSSLAVTLAVFGIAVFLFGFSLTPEGRRRGQLFARTAGALAVAAAINAGAASLRETAAAPDAAAASYAHGMVALETGEYDEAVLHFNRAIELRPTFARAYRERSTALFRADSPQVSGYTSLTSEDALARSNDDMRQAVKLGLTSPDILGSLGFGLFQEGLLADDNDLLEEAEEVTRQAVAADPREPVNLFNLGLIQLARDRPGEADATYREAVAKLM